MEVALIADRRLARAHHPAKRVPGYLQIPNNLLDRNASFQMIPTDPREHFHNQHPLNTSLVQTTKCVQVHKKSEINFARRLSPSRGQYSTPTHSLTLNPNWLRAFERTCRPQALDPAIFELFDLTRSLTAANVACVSHHRSAADPYFSRTHNSFGNYRLE